MRRISLGAVLSSLALSLAFVQPAAATLLMSKPDKFAPYLVQNTTCTPGTVTSSDIPLCTTHRTVVSNAIPHYPDLGDTATTNIPALQSYISTCTSTNVGVKGLCMQVTAAMKLIQEDTNMLTQLGTDTETYSGTDDSGNPYSYVQLSKANTLAWRNAVRSLEAILFTDGLMLNHGAYFPTMAYDSTIKTIPTTDGRWQAVSTAYDAVKAAGQTFESDTLSPCFAAYLLIFTAGEQDDVDKDTAPEMRNAMIACNQKVLASGSKYLAAIDGLDQALGSASKSGNVAGGQGSGSVLTLPLPLADISLPSLIGRVIKQLLSIVGALALAFFVWGGLRWMLARGVPEEVAKAKKIIVAAISGLFAIFASYAILNLIINALK